MDDSHIKTTTVSAAPTVSIETHGCKLNTADSQRMATALTDHGYAIADVDESPNVWVINSCTVTHVADKKARQAISAARRKFPEALIVVAGCYVERDPETVAALVGVDLAIPNTAKHNAVDLISDRLGLKATPCADGASADTGFMLLGRSRASVKIQEGCNQVCAYCIVPTVRGRERSIPTAEIVDEINSLISGGAREVVLTGTQLGSYGFDLHNQSLSSMIATVLDETSIERLRVSSLQPLEITDELLELWTGIGANRLCAHFHVPLQAGSDRVLSTMRRRYTAEEYLASLERIRAAVPDAAITTDVIAGFPGETDDEFQRSVEIVAEANYADVHIFPYSSRPGTSAAHFGGHLNPAIVAERAARLREIGARSFNAFRQQLVGTTARVLWERDEPSIGLTDSYVRAQLGSGQRSGRARVNSIEEVALIEFDGKVMLAEPLTNGTEAKPTVRI
ncbi:MAG: tRNA (N(6)-L-threonylcarbamoyladenosine(37)-C(2))-methylthiotransferase MtaB [Chloroflexi bacterium]|nr:tRNA (N(6)-L-threonylcarbamoyladenosine(37)-C(2))-methylthiotransferase MtaB [Chloroflexota bacterium]